MPVDEMYVDEFDVMEHKAFDVQGKNMLFWYSAGIITGIMTSWCAASFKRMIATDIYVTGRNV